MARTPAQLKALRDPRTNQLDTHSKSMIFDGCNLSQLCSIFKMDRRTITEKIREVSPAGERSGYAVYHIHEVAPYIVKPMYDVETYLKRMNHKDLPPHLTKEFWAALRTKQEYELKEGMLWRTDDVVLAVSELLKTLKMSMQLVRDTIERDTVLTETQSKRITSLMDGAMSEMADAVYERFNVESDDEEEDSDEL